LIFNTTWEERKKDKNIGLIKLFRLKMVGMSEDDLEVG
jgi:hypothetical protein